VNFGIGVSWWGTFKNKKKLLKISILFPGKILKRGKKTLQIFVSLNFQIRKNNCFGNHYLLREYFRSTKDYLNILFLTVKFQFLKNP
jgi:hypothetical protein